MANVVLTVIVPSFNSERFIEATLKSIAATSCPEVEYLFIDGGSTDSTMEIVGRYKGLFSKIISEPDKGQSDAFNKGFSIGEGRFVTWLNSDDLINGRALPKVVDYLKKTNALWVTANSVYIDEEGCVLRCCRAGGFEAIPVKLGLLNVFGPSTFVAKELYEQIGKFDINFHYCMDADYWWRIVSAGYRFKRISVYFWGLRLHDGAKTAGVLLNNTMPEGMKAESVSIRQRFYLFGSLRLRRCGVFLARVYRIFNFSLPRAILDTRRFRGRDFSEIYL